MLIGARTAAWGGGGGRPIPADCVEVEYLESTGTQFINLDFGFDPTDEIDAEFSIDVTEKIDKYIVSPNLWNTGKNRFAMGVHTGSIGVKGAYCSAYGDVVTSSTAMLPTLGNDGGIHRWTYANKVFSVVDLGLARDCSEISFGATTYKLKLFYGYNTNTRGRIARYKHIKADGIGVDLVPVRRTTDGLGYMCDLLTGELYGNSGTGKFVIGPDK